MSACLVKPVGIMTKKKNSQFKSFIFYMADPNWHQSASYGRGTMPSGGERHSSGFYG